MAEFMMIICDNEIEKGEVSVEVTREHYEKVGEWWNEHEKAGRILPGGRRLRETSTAMTVRLTKGQPVMISDGPFAETKEQVGGFGILSVPDMQAAVDLVSTWPGLAETIEIRPIAG